MIYDILKSVLIQDFTALHKTEWNQIRYSWNARTYPYWGVLAFLYYWTVVK